MAQDMLGPLGPRAATTRPAHDPDPYGTETWYKDCSAPGAADGTVPTASGLNVFLGNMRFAIAAVGWTPPAGTYTQQTADRVLYDVIQKSIDIRLTSSGAGLRAVGSII
jgi:hypothetical protein